jgi:hypothetical protein
MRIRTFGLDPLADPAGRIGKEAWKRGIKRKGRQSYG